MLRSEIHFRFGLSIKGEEDFVLKSASQIPKFFRYGYHEKRLRRQYRIASAFYKYPTRLKKPASLASAAF